MSDLLLTAVASHYAQEKYNEIFKELYENKACLPESFKDIFLEQTMFAFLAGYNFKKEIDRSEADYLRHDIEKDYLTTLEDKIYQLKEKLINQENYENLGDADADWCDGYLAELTELKHRITWNYSPEYLDGMLRAGTDLRKEMGEEFESVNPYFEKRNGGSNEL